MRMESGVYKVNYSRALIKVNTVDPLNLKTPVTSTVVTGPKENFFLSVDANFSDLKTAREAINGKEPQKKAERLFLGLNYMVGDIYAQQPKFSLDRVVVKAMVTPNQSFESYGVGIGYRLFSSFSVGGTTDLDSHSGLVIYYGRFWTRPGKTTGSMADIDSRRIPSNSWGISYSLGSALDWLKPSK